MNAKKYRAANWNWNCFSIALKIFNQSPLWLVGVKLICEPFKRLFYQEIQLFRWNFYFIHWGIQFLCARSWENSIKTASFCLIRKLYDLNNWICMTHIQFKYQWQIIELFDMLSSFHWKSNFLVGNYFFGNFDWIID